MKNVSLIVSNIESRVLSIECQAWALEPLQLAQTDAIRTTRYSRQTTR